MNLSEQGNSILSVASDPRLRDQVAELVRRASTRDSADWRRFTTGLVRVADQIRANIKGREMQPAFGPPWKNFHTRGLGRLRTVPGQEIDGNSLQIIATGIRGILDRLPVEDESERLVRQAILLYLEAALFFARYLSGSVAPERDDDACLAAIDQLLTAARYLDPDVSPESLLRKFLGESDLDTVVPGDTVIPPSPVAKADLPSPPEGGTLEDVPVRSNVKGSGEIRDPVAPTVDLAQATANVASGTRQALDNLQIAFQLLAGKPTADPDVRRYLPALLRSLDELSLAVEVVGGRAAILFWDETKDSLGVRWLATGELDTWEHVHPIQRLVANQKIPVAQDDGPPQWQDGLAVPPSGRIRTTQDVSKISPKEFFSYLDSITQRAPNSFLQEQFQAFLLAQEGKEYGSLEGNQSFAVEVQKRLRAMGLAVECCKCGVPANFRCNRSGTSKNGMFHFTHSDGGIVSKHAWNARVPRLTLAQRPADSRHKSL